ncbi:MAG: undecaprenyl/decaprenyl-phosphate alpha-N-acetylglucosaminyl 1-phosphate transferase [Clostridia bacterium]|nr:undecaprenyl/decaprenyl-phosphate alpha-N-acetylglucosaminyl 1-phosphate transferase [Clostridia bacterium]
MTQNQLLYGIVALICASLLAYAMTPIVRVLAFRIGAVDVPLDNRRIHKKPMPRIGGLAIYLSFTLTTIIFCQPTQELTTIWIGGGIIVILGILDDIYRLNAWLKLVVQLLVAVFAVWNGCVIDHINLGGVYVSLGFLSWPLSVLWISGLTNAINFIDGLDGLACGVSAISALSLLFVVMLQGDFISATICAILFGSCLGFLPFNFNPARIFMGDTGALFLGYTLAVISVFGVFKLHTVLAFLVPFAIFALPVFDTLFAICRRVLSGKSPFAPDRGHIHHRLIDMGFTQKESVKILYAICGVFGLVAVFCTESMFQTMRVTKSILIAVIATGLFLLNYLILKDPNWRKHSGLTEDDMTVIEYINELDPEKARKIEAHNGGHVKKDEETSAAEEKPEESGSAPETTDEPKS